MACARKGHPTSIQARKAAKKAGLKGEFREVEKCRDKACGRWHIRLGLL